MNKKKSSIEDLISRGFIDHINNDKLNEYNDYDIYELLESKIPTERSIAARLFNENKPLRNNTIALITALKKETKLYSKIEICNALTIQGINDIDLLIKEQGKIGKNQHTMLPTKPFLKKSYPLPRDIISRILIRMPISILEELIMLSEGLDKKGMREFIDVVGHLSFQHNNTDAYQYIMKWFWQYEDDDVIRWKIYRACSAFKQSEKFLAERKAKETNDMIISEIERSLSAVEDKL